jgi:prolyl-tRNA synthetase
MMQDGKALQAGTSHYLGTNFAEAAGIKYQDREGGQQLCHTTSWGVSTRLIGGVIMTHGDDDGLRVPPRIAPHQVVILPMLRDDDSDTALLEYCESLRAKLAGQNALGEPIRVLLDKRPGKAAAKRWDWVRKGVPLIVEVGQRDVSEGKVAVLRRNALWNEAAKTNFSFEDVDQFAGNAAGDLEAIQSALFEEARQRRDDNIARDVSDMAGLAEFFADSKAFPGWVEVEWCRPSGDQLEKVVEQLKELKLTIRNVPLDAKPATGNCIFTGAPAVERIYVARAY